MRTTQRIAKKRAAQSVALMFDMPFVLEHAKPSLFHLPFGTMRTYVYHQMRKLGVRTRAAKWATWRWAEQFRRVPPSEGTEP